MQPSDTLEYELVDAGDGEKLERLGGVLVARPAPAAREPKRGGACWEEAAARFDAHAGWTLRTPLPDPWLARAHSLTFHLEPTPSGQVGWFPEKTALVDELAALISRGVRVLHIFAYTGAATLALARAGARVTHVDAASSAVAWARRNAMRNDLAERPIRWIVEDAARWVARETRRGALYDAILLDPPSFGRGGGKRSWQMERDLEPLLAASTALLSSDPLFVALTAHTEGMTSAALATALDRALPNRSGRTRHGAIELGATSGAQLPAGVFAHRAFGVDFPRRAKRGEPT